MASHSDSVSADQVAPLACIAPVQADSSVVSVSSNPADAHQADTTQGHFHPAVPPVHVNITQQGNMDDHLPVPVVRFLAPMTQSLDDMLAAEEALRASRPMPETAHELTEEIMIHYNAEDDVDPVLAVCSKQFQLD